MSRRRSETLGESLELLLDTVCNVFGGIIFIAILVSMLTSATTSQIRSAHHEVIQQIEDTRERTELDSKIHEYRLAMEQLKKTQDSVAGDDSDRAVRFIAAMDGAQKHADATVKQLEAWLSQFDHAQQQQTSDLHRDRAATKRAIAELLHELKNLEQGTRVDVRLPMERVTPKDQIIMLFQGGRAYVVPSRGTIGLNYPGEDVESTQISGGKIIRPIVGAGFATDPANENDPRWRALLDGVTPDRAFFDLFVLPDSVKAYRQFRDRVVSAGYSYNLHPLEKAPLVLGPTNVVKVQ